VERVRRKHKLAEHYVLHVGINKSHKNLRKLLQAWRQVVNSEPTLRSFQLALAGPRDPRYPEPVRLAEQLEIRETVHSLGLAPEPDLPAIYSGATLFVLPSLYEGFGLPALEAMACGTPVLCSNSSSLPEVTGNAAVLFDPTSVDAIAAALQRGLTSPGLQADLRERGLEQAARFSWSQTARATRELYALVASP
jgi:alpha-1,3-rhamnosyl/mannosyltransferase